MQGTYNKMQIFIYSNFSQIVFQYMKIILAMFLSRKSLRVLHAPWTASAQGAAQVCGQENPPTTHGINMNTEPV